MAVPEAILVKDVLTTCQSINARYIWLQGTSDSGARFACGPGAEVPATQQQLIGRVAELGWLLRRVTELTAACSGQHSAVHEAVAAAAQREVSSYYRLVAILEAQAAQQAWHATTAAAGGSGAAGASATAPGAGAALPAAAAAASTAAARGAPGGELTLRRVEVWMAEPMARLRVLAACLETVRPLRGGQLINALHARSKHGDPLVRQVVGPLLDEACSPFFKQVARCGGAATAHSSCCRVLWVPFFIGCVFRCLRPLSAVPVAGPGLCTHLFNHLPTARSNGMP